MIGIIMRLAVRSCAYDLAYIRNAINTANAGPDPKKYGQMLLMRGKTKNKKLIVAGQRPKNCFFCRGRQKM